jgi:hypothetical protein
MGGGGGGYVHTGLCTCPCFAPPPSSRLFPTGCPFCTLHQCALSQSESCDRIIVHVYRMVHVYLLGGGGRTALLRCVGCGVHDLLVAGIFCACVGRAHAAGVAGASTKCFQFSCLTLLGTRTRCGFSSSHQSATQRDLTSTLFTCTSVPLGPFSRHRFRWRRVGVCCCCVALIG